MISKKLRQLSLNFKDLGNMHPSYKGFAAFSEVSSELQKAILLSYIENISLILINYDESKIIWINKDLYEKYDKALIYIENKFLVLVNKDIVNNKIILTSKHYNNEELINILLNMNIFEYENMTINNNIPYVKDSFFLILKMYISENCITNISQSEKLRYIIGEHIYNYLIMNKSTPYDMALLFDESINNFHNKITYLLC